MPLNGISSLYPQVRTCDHRCNSPEHRRGPTTITTKGWKKAPPQCPRKRLDMVSCLWFPSRSCFFWLVVMFFRDAFGYGDAIQLLWVGGSVHFGWEQCGEALGTGGVHPLNSWRVMFLLNSWCFVSIKPMSSMKAQQRAIHKAACDGAHDFYKLKGSQLPCP